VITRTLDKRIGNQHEPRAAPGAGMYNRGGRLVVTWQEYSLHTDPVILAARCVGRDRYAQSGLARLSGNDIPDGDLLDWHLKLKQASQTQGQVGRVVERTLHERLGHIRGEKKSQ